jgi:nucleotidyltransferase/DNA polymerase involved in DNA repair
MSRVPLTCIPALAGKADIEVREGLQVATVGEIAQFSEEELAGKFGAKRARMLRALLHGGCDGEVAEEDATGSQGGQGSVAVERSYQLSDRPSTISAAVWPLAQSLMSRLVRSSCF